MKLPEPPVPADADLRHFITCQMEIDYFLSDPEWINAPPDVAKARLTLRIAAWRQIPAGSLPNDDRTLAHLSLAGRRWKAIKDDVLKGWTECSDGRLYQDNLAQSVRKVLLKSKISRDRVAQRWGKTQQNQQNGDTVVIQGEERRGEESKQATCARTCEGQPGGAGLPPFMLSDEPAQSTVSVPRPKDQAPPDKQPPDYGAGEGGLGIVIAWREIVGKIWGQKPGWPSVRSSAHLLAGWVAAGWEPKGFSETAAYVLAKRHDRGEPPPSSLSYLEKPLQQYANGLPDDCDEWIGDFDLGAIPRQVAPA